MTNQRPQWCGPIRTALAAATLTLVAGCAGGYRQPAPVFYGDAAAGGAAPAYLRPVEAPPPLRVTVHHGDSLRRLARTYHVPERAIIAANGLAPPYRLEPGRRLVIPRDDRLAGPLLPSPPPHEMRDEPAIVPLDSPPQAPEPLTAPLPMHEHAAATNPDVIPLSGPAQPEPAHELRPVDTKPAETKPESTAHAVRAPEAREVAADVASETAHRPEAAPAPAEHDADTGHDTAHGGRFVWPVRGHILEDYGTTGSGAQNDGINIAASRGTPVRAVAAGTVAYVGNQLRGYGNLVLVKHAHGWISAYAHCETVAVKKGEHVARGQIIARVGATGNVAEPQLHFELRRGKDAVDPRNYLTPLPSAAKGGAVDRRLAPVSIT